LHPARILRGGWALEPAQIDYLIYAREVYEGLLRGEEPILVKLPESAKRKPEISEMSAWVRGDLSQGMAIDIETKGQELQGVGFCRVADLAPIWIPLIWNGVRTEPHHEAWIRQRLASKLLKVWHNGVGFDIPFLIRAGYEVEPPWKDTMISAHIHMPEHPKGLQWLATTHLRFPVWKDMVDPQEEEGIK
jgi:hypothetical protein